MNGGVVPHDIETLTPRGPLVDFLESAYSSQLARQAECKKRAQNDSYK